MGINSSIINAGMLIGSIVSGELTTTFGYSATFILAIVALAASFVMLSRTSGQKSIVIIETTKTWT
jgi:predicted MFS family arabinose efflux permease